MPFCLNYSHIYFNLLNLKLFASPQIVIPCRPRKTFTLYVLDVPEDLPVEDIRHSLYKFDSVVEVVRLHIYHQVASPPTSEKIVEGKWRLKSA